MVDPFSGTKLGPLSLKNYFMRSPTWEGLADSVDGAPTEKLINMYVDLAKGGVGLIVGSFAFVCNEGRHTDWQLGITTDEVIPAHRKLVVAVKDASPDAKIILQLVHAGVVAAGTEFEKLKEKAKGASAIEFRNRVVRDHKEMTKEDIAETVGLFAAAAARAKKAGYDGVEIHAAHGFLISQFASPFFNKRTDEYGGSVENRARFGVEVCKAIREAVPDESFLLMAKYNTQDYLPGGIGVEESIEIATLLEAAGLQGIELSGGTAWSIPSPFGANPGKKNPEGWWKEESRKFKSALKIPVCLVGGFRVYDTCKTFLADGVCDIISMSRPFVSEPDLLKRWQEELTKGGPCKKSRCTSCNKCFKPANSGKGIECIFVTKAREKAEKAAKK